MYIVLFLFQSVVMLMFREEKSPEDEIKAWQFWHGRQHSVKQRILDAGKYLPSQQTNPKKNRIMMVICRDNTENNLLFLLVF